jgi:hypothetical protein
MVRVKAADVLRNVDFDKYLSSNPNKDNVNLSNQFSLDNKKRFGLRGLSDNKKNKSIFQDLSRALDDIEEERLNEEGPLLTSKLEGTYTSSINRKNNPEMERALDQVGGGRKRKYVHHDKKCKEIVKLCGEISHEGKSKKKKKMTRKKKKRVGHKKKHSGSTSRKRRKSGRKRGSGRKHKKKQSGKKRHFKKHNIFSD